MWRTHWPQAAPCEGEKPCRGGRVRCRWNYRTGAGEVRHERCVPVHAGRSSAVSQAGWLKHQISLLRVLEAGSSRSRCTQGWCLVTASHMTFPLCKCRERERSLRSCPLLIRTPVRLASCPMTSCSLLRPLLQIQSHCGLGLPSMTHGDSGNTLVVAVLEAEGMIPPKKLQIRVWFVLCSVLKMAGREHINVCASNFFRAFESSGNMRPATTAGWALRPGTRFTFPKALPLPIAQALESSSKILGVGAFPNSEVFRFWSRHRALVLYHLALSLGVVPRS